MIFSTRQLFPICSVQLCFWALVDTLTGMIDGETALLRTSTAGRKVYGSAKNRQFLNTIAGAFYALLVSKIFYFCRKYTADEANTQ
jgi:hypothetical protein